MKRIIVALALSFVGSAFAQQKPLTPEQQQAQDAIGVLQKDAQVEHGQRLQAELAIVKLQRDLAEAQKEAAACKPEPKKEKK